MTEPTVSESLDIDASATRIFSFLSDPAMQPAVDGTGMLRSAVDNAIITQVGDVFYMEMVHWDMGNYVMANHVVEFEQDRRIAWEPIVHSHERSENQKYVGQQALRRWGWQLEPLSDERTRVTEFFDGSLLPEELRKFIEDGEFWRPAMVTSLENLKRLVSQSGEASQTAYKFRNSFIGDLYSCVGDRKAKKRRISS